VVAIVIFGYLGLTEVQAYMYPQLRPQVVTDSTPLAVTLPLSLSISFLELPCDRVHVDTAEVNGGGGGEMATTTGKRSVVKTSLLPGAVEKPKDFCGSCYEASDVARCCNTCAELRSALIRKFGSEAGGSAPMMHHKYDAGGSSPAPVCIEGCRVDADILVAKGRGTLHAAAGRGVEMHHGGHAHHGHQLAKADLMSFNTSHIIHHFRFGDTASGANSPLSGQRYIEKVPLSLHRYTLKAVMVDYLGDYSCQYTFSHLRETINPSLSTTFSLPGLFFSYDIDALGISIGYEERDFFRFATRLAGLLGGFWTVAGLVAQTLASAMPGA
jgi:hypothetical protein